MSPERCEGACQMAKERCSSRCMSRCSTVSMTIVVSPSSTRINVWNLVKIWHVTSYVSWKPRKPMKVNDRVGMFFDRMANSLGEYTCEIDDGRGVKTTGYLYVDGKWSWTSGSISSLLVEPQWRFETKLPPTLEGDPGDTIELECTVQDEDADCEWSFAGDVSDEADNNRSRDDFFCHRSSLRNPIRRNTKSFLMTKFVNWSWRIFDLEKTKANTDAKPVWWQRPVTWMFDVRDRLGTKPLSVEQRSSSSF